MMTVISIVMKMISNVRTQRLLLILRRGLLTVIKINLQIHFLTTLIYASGNNAEDSDRIAMIGMANYNTSQI